MFGFSKKKKENSQTREILQVVLTDERKEQLLQTIFNKHEELKELNEVEQAKIYESIGLAYYELGQEVEAIDAFEKSLELKKSIGDGYKSLLKLYNKKRAEAAKANDEESLQKYLVKMDQLMQVSKDVTRGLR